ncbi:SDR family oxidoreductase [Actinopolyspora erythraea]|uniref:Polysaccharide biosynthesis family protein n=1 Tax=Actinopolyspora erythraea TaxID=414996 RepID=A0A099D7Q1_9ACTN|nr:SDR family NAD(P)-dependent oxidoreductase [Actinopolyspora erythraea]ASU78661.1 SDR family oxidoreductase [Actinopolyspora erythraea]KGI81420.1 polysaccharide biosynthesis family protein [Actinopolyspora erythraea]
MTTRTALLIGAAGGILSQVAHGLAEEGHTLVLFDQDEKALDELSRELQQHTKVETVVGDITDIATAEGQLTDIAERHAPSILVNGVGGDTRVIGYAELTTDYFEQSYLENVISTFIAIKACAPRMAEAGYGRIVNFASTGGRTYSHFNNAAYVGAKASVIGMSKQMAYELASTGVCVNVVAHGPIATRRVAEAFEQRDEEAKQRVLSKLPMGRYGTVEEAAGSVLHLCSESAGYSTGSVIDVNGGLYI